jgi:hypothetical protein
MSRRDRRRLAAGMKKQPINPLTAVHEAGHAVARYIVANEMGIPQEKCIDRIVMEQRIFSTQDGVTWVSEAVTYGPLFSRDIQAVITRGKPPAPPSDDEIIQFVWQAKLEGADVRTWLNAKALVIIMGPLAEACATGQAIENVLLSNASRGDLEDLSRYCKWAAITEDDAGKVLADAIQRGIELTRQPRISTAIHRAAQQLIGKSEISGKEIVAVIEQAISETQPRARRAAASAARLSNRSLAIPKPVHSGLRA